MVDDLSPTFRDSKLASVAEIALVFVVAFAVIFVGWNIVGDDTFARQAVVWVANVLMMVTVWMGLRLRGQTWGHFGLNFRFGGKRVLRRTVLLSLAVLVAAIAGFMIGSIVAANLMTIPEGADMSGYNYLQGNLPMLLLALAGVYVVSSFGEEVIYRGFLINRIAEICGSGKAAWRIAVVISAVVFGLVHFSWGLFGVVQTMFMGLALAIAYLVVDRKLWVLILAHAYMDTVLLVQVYLGMPDA